MDYTLVSAVYRGKKILKNGETYAIRVMQSNPFLGNGFIRVRLSDTISIDYPNIGKFLEDWDSILVIGTNKQNNGADTRTKKS